jgi:hypothetical protein
MVAVQMMVRRAQPCRSSAGGGSSLGADRAEKKRGECRHESRVAGQKYTGIGQNEIISGKILQNPDLCPPVCLQPAFGIIVSAAPTVGLLTCPALLLPYCFTTGMIRSFTSLLLPGLCGLLLSLAATSGTLAQTGPAPAMPPASLLPLPQASPHVLLAHTIGLSEVTVDYHAPGVRNRVIWEGLVPYGQIWRAGANENTLITFTDTVRVNGKMLPAGKYSFYIFPRSDQDWDMVFNRVTTHWGAEGYDQKDDVLRVPVVPEVSTFHETLLYWFSDVKPGNAHFNLSWEKKTVSVLIDTNVQAKVVAGIEKAVAQRPGDWQLLAQAADYLVQNNLHAERALYFINESIRLRDVYTNNWIKARLLASKLDYDTAIVYGRKAIKLGDKDDVAFRSQLPNMRTALIEWQGKAY